ncbi:hypothetical protein [Streptomyces niveiscabiei]|uniref:Uncharacterized protein n=1 Tax=Streptomyces niveiscabiei TaxID=164115 RepID=A0ABW9HX07_9ACTN
MSYRLWDTGSHRTRGQPKDVWFLAGTFGGQADRMCEVPEGRPIAVPVVNLVGDDQDCAAFTGDFSIGVDYALTVSASSN